MWNLNRRHPILAIFTKKVVINFLIPPKMSIFALRIIGDE